MTAEAVGLGLDPLIAEAKDRARRRRLLALVALMVVAAGSVAGTTYGLRSSANSRGICATAPSGWKERFVTFSGPTPPTLVLTNFRFGQMDDLYGFTDPRLRWPPNGVTVAVSNSGPARSPSKAAALGVAATDFRGMEGARKPFANVSVTSRGRILDAYVMVGALTPGTIAAANEVLADVRTCST